MLSSHLHLPRIPLTPPPNSYGKYDGSGDYGKYADYGKYPRAAAPEPEAAPEPAPEAAPEPAPGYGSYAPYSGYGTYKPADNKYGKYSK